MLNLLETLLNFSLSFSLSVVFGATTYLEVSSNVLGKGAHKTEGINNNNIVIVLFLQCLWVLWNMFYYLIYFCDHSSVNTKESQQICRTWQCSCLESVIVTIVLVFLIFTFNFSLLILGNVRNGLWLTEIVMTLNLWMALFSRPIK